jgi:hypothetical protein
MYVSSKEDIPISGRAGPDEQHAQRLSETVLDPSSPERSLEIGFASYCQIVSRFRRPIRLLYREVGFLPSEPRANVIATVSSVINYFENIVAKGIDAGVFRNVPARLTGLDVMFIAHMIALHTREVRAVGDLDAYINYQLDSIFAGLLVAPEKRTSGSRQRAKVASMRTKTAKKLARAKASCAFATLNAQICIAYARIIQQLASQTAHHDTARFDHITAVGNRERRIGILLDQQNRQPTAFSPLMIEKICSTSMGESPIEGSSSNTSFGRAISARPITNICCWPPDSSATVVRLSASAGKVV